MGSGEKMSTKLAESASFSVGFGGRTTLRERGGRSDTAGVTIRSRPKTGMTSIGDDGADKLSRVRKRLVYGGAAMIECR